jgi:tripartite-type tricarboxylate transporter receptor subunit TctC
LSFLGFSCVLADSARRRWPALALILHHRGMLSRRHLAALLPPLLAAPAWAQDPYPNRPIKLIIPVGVAGATDIVGRLLAEAMTPLLGRPVVSENIAGAGSTIGAAAFLRQPADGYTLFIGTNNHPVMQAVRPDFPHDPARDFQAICLIARQPNVLTVHPSVPARDVAALLAWLRTEKDAVNYGSTFPGATNHLAGELLKSLAGLDFTLVPYRTAALSVQDLVAGRVQFTIDSPMMLAPLIQEGRLRGLAVTGAERTDLLPGLPTLAEAGVPGYELTAWQVLFVKPGTPPEIAQKLTAAAEQAVADPAFRAKLRQNSAEPFPATSPALATAFVKDQTERWSAIVKRIGLKAE